MIFSGLGPDHSVPSSTTCSQPHPWFPIFGESMGVSCSSPKSCFPFGTCGVSLLGSCCEIETKGVSPLGTATPHPCLGTACPSKDSWATVPWRYQVLEAIIELQRRKGKLEQNTLVQAGVRCISPSGSSSSTHCWCGGVWVWWGA